MFFKIFITILVLYCIKCLLKWLLKYINDVQTYWNIKSWSFLPVIGNLHQFDNNGVSVLKAVMEMSREFTDETVFKFMRGWVPIIVFHRAEGMHVLYSGAENTSKTFDYLFIEAWLKKGLLTSDGKKWLERRKIITPTFHFDILKDFIFIMNENVETMTNNLRKKIQKDSEINIHEHIGLCALDIICESAMGQNINAQNNKNSEYINAVTEISILVRARTCNPLHWNDFIYNFTENGKKEKKCLEILHGFTRDIIKKRNEDFEICNINNQKRIAFLDLLLKAKKLDDSLTFEDIQEEVDTFMFEGHDTTTGAATWAVHLIGSHQEVQTKIQEELDCIFGDTDRHVTNEDLSKMNYMECVIKEALRLFPSVPFHGRTMTEDAVVDGHKIKKGSTIYAFIYGLHRDPKYFPDPERFDPSRFLLENSRNRHPFAFAPFAAGRRNCIGQRFAMMELKIELSALFRNFNIISSKDIEEIAPCADIILKPLNGLPVSIKLRK